MGSARSNEPSVEQFLQGTLSSYNSTSAILCGVMEIGDVPGCYSMQKSTSLGGGDEPKTNLFLIHFYGMFLTILDIFLFQIMEYSPTLCFVGVN